MAVRLNCFFRCCQDCAGLARNVFVTKVGCFAMAKEGNSVVAPCGLHSGPSTTLRAERYGLWPAVCGMAEAMPLTKTVPQQAVCTVRFRSRSSLMTRLRHFADRCRDLRRWLSISIQDTQGRSDIDGSRLQRSAAYRVLDPGLRPGL